MNTSDFLPLNIFENFTLVYFFNSQKISDNKGDVYSIIWNKEDRDLVLWSK